MTSTKNAGHFICKIHNSKNFSYICDIKKNNIKLTWDYQNGLLS